MLNAEYMVGTPSPFLVEHGHYFQDAMYIAPIKRPPPFCNARVHILVRPRATPPPSMTLQDMNDQKPVFPTPAIPSTCAMASSVGAPRTKIPTAKIPTRTDFGTATLPPNHTAPMQKWGTRLVEPSCPPQNKPEKTPADLQNLPKMHPQNPLRDVYLRMQARDDADRQANLRVYKKYRLQPDQKQAALDYPGNLEYDIGNICAMAWGESPSRAAFALVKYGGYDAAMEALGHACERLIGSQD